MKAIDPERGYSFATSRWPERRSQRGSCGWRGHLADDGNRRSRQGVFLSSFALRISSDPAVIRRYLSSRKALISPVRRRSGGGHKAEWNTDVADDADNSRMTATRETTEVCLLIATPFASAVIPLSSDGISVPGKPWSLPSPKTREAPRHPTRGIPEITAARAPRCSGS